MTLNNQLVRSVGVSLLTGLLMLTTPTVQAADPIGRDRAAELVQQRYGGKVLDLQRVGSGNKMAYRVKLLQPSGRVKLILIDATSGKDLPFKGRQ
ncbi:PepSY domain-containing protein [Motiliproteus sp.]|uniref:PepSY domain-containing protein n=1 Tax=Motiliproteus sp. TaxID=1898955 RepID=UPI003BA9958E